MDGTKQEVELVAMTHAGTFKFGGTIGAYRGIAWGRGARNDAPDASFWRRFP